MATTDADLAWFTEVDLDEATSRLTRLAVCYQARLTGLPDSILDARPTETTWTLREVVLPVVGDRFARHETRKGAGAGDAAHDEGVVVRAVG
jgi:hypothetical protein